MKRIVISWRSALRSAPRYTCAVALAAAACSGDDHPPLPPGENISSTGGSGGHSGVRPVLDGGAGAHHSRTTEDASAPGASRRSKDASAPESGRTGADAGCTHPVPGALPSGTAFVCSTTAKWSDGTVIQSASTSAHDVFSAITPDELTIVWMSITASGPVLRYADRDSATGSFAPYGYLTSDYFAAERAAVSPDGARIVVVRKDKKGFGEFVRRGRFYSFDITPSEASFAALDSQGRMLETSEFFGDPVLSSDDRTFYYSKYGSEGTVTVFAATRSDPVPWPLGTPVEGAPLLNDCGARRRPTGVSADGLTLFYYDESSGSERATWRKSTDSAFSGFVDLGSRIGAQPNAACTSLYFSLPAADASTDGDELVATAE
jgi:hypothetical protein